MEGDRMKNMLMGTVLVLSVCLWSCSGYFNQGDVTGDQLADTLAIEGGGGYLSGPSNEISPYLYRDMNKQNPALFFSSDRDGDYDIYYAPMNGNGKFQELKKLSESIINLTNQELYPQVYYAYDYNYSNILLLSFVRIVGGSNFICTYQTDTEFSVFISNSFFYQYWPVSSLFVVNDYYYPTLWVVDDYSSDIKTYGWSPFYERIYYEATNYLTSPLPGLQSIYYFNDGNNAYSGDVNLMEFNADYRSQLYISYYFTRTNPPGQISQLYPVREYTSSYNDRWPYVDVPDNAKVYFASDRGENGDYDLFRYNSYSLSNVLPVNPFETTNSTQSES